MLPLTLLGARILDFNCLYHRLGVSMLMAEHASCSGSRRAHHDLAGAYVARIAQAQRRVRQATT